MLRKWDTNDQQLNTTCLNEVITRIQEIEDTEQVGQIAAQEIVDIVLENFAPTIYNKGINDSVKLIQEKLADLESDIELLRQ